MQRVVLPLSVLVLVLSVAGCGSDKGATTDATTEGTPGDVVGADAADEASAEATDETLSQAQLYLRSDDYAAATDPALTSANTRFAVKLFLELNASEAAGKNLFVSPFSVSTALTMAYNGATGDTKTAMAEALQYSGLDLDTLDADYLDLIRSLEDVDQDVSLAIANSIWTDSQFAPSVAQAFLDVMKESFLSELFTEDFGAPETLGKINGWIEDHTNGKIKDMLDQISEDAVMSLINALYFKAAWTYPFDPANTSEWDFTKADGSVKKAQMMTYKDLVTSFAYATDGDFCAVRLPYGRDKVAFYGFVPCGYGSEKTIEDLLADLTAEKLEAWFATVAYPQGEYEGIAIALPKFKIEYKKTLNDALKALGMGPAFELGGFDGIAPGIGISRVLHQTYIEVNEEGTEAAAATIVEMDQGIPPSFIGDKPFFFVIRDDRSGSILFMGKVADPQ
jgi:serine protease inhibitor